MTDKARAELLSIRQQLKQISAALDTVEQALGNQTEENVPTANDWVADFQSLGAATAILKRKHQTAAQIVEEHGLGVLIRKVWSVDLNRCRAFMEKRPYPPLRP